MKVYNLPLVQVLSICNILRIKFITSEDNYVQANAVCIWCNHRIYIGLQYKDVPQDVRAYFLTPQNYERYVNEVEGLAVS